MSKSFSRLPDCLWQPLVKWQSPSGALRPQQSFRPFHFQPPTSQLETFVTFLEKTIEATMVDDINALQRLELKEAFDEFDKVMIKSNLIVSSMF